MIRRLISIALLVGCAGGPWAEAQAARRLGQGAVVYEVKRGVQPILRSSGNAAVVIDVTAGQKFAPRAPRGPFKPKHDPRTVLLTALTNGFKVHSQERLVEEYYRRLGIVVPASFNEQSLFGRTVAGGGWKNGDLVYFSSETSKAPARVCLYLEPDRLLFYLPSTGKIEHAQVGKEPWKGSWLFTRRILGTVFEQYLRGGAATVAAKGRPNKGPAPLPEHYETEMEGIASLYGDGDGSHGKETANGEVFDEEALTCAHRTLPFHTWVLVTNVENGRRVIVRVNDRGPFAQKERVVDLSLRAARLLGMDRKGTAKVRLNVIRVAHENL